MSRWPLLRIPLVVLALKARPEVNRPTGGVNGATVDPFTVKLFRASLFRVNPFTVNRFKVNPFTVNRFMVNPFTVNRFKVNPWGSTTAAGAVTGMRG